MALTATERRKRQQEILLARNAPRAVQAAKPLIGTAVQTSVNVPAGAPPIFQRTETGTPSQFRELQGGGQLGQAAAQATQQVITPERQLQQTTNMNDLLRQISMFQQQIQADKGYLASANTEYTKQFFTNRIAQSEEQLANLQRQYEFSNTTLASLGQPPAKTPQTTTKGDLGTFAQLPGLLSQTGGTIGGTTGTDSLSFNTGNAELDQFLNETLVPLFEQEFSKDPLAALDPKIFSDISQRIEATYGPLFQKAIQLAENEFGRAGEELAFQKERIESGLSTTELRAQEDQASAQRRLEEDKVRTLADNARNFDEMKLEISNNFRQRGLTFSGLREEGERKLGEANLRAIGDIERGAGRQREDIDLLSGRTLQDVGRERDFLGREVGFRQRGLESGLTRERERMAGERLLQEAEEKRRLQDLAATILLR